MESKVHLKSTNPQWSQIIQPGKDWFDLQDHPEQDASDQDIITQTVKWLAIHAGIPGIDWAWAGWGGTSFKVFFRESEMAAVFCLAHGIS